MKTLLRLLIASALLAGAAWAEVRTIVSNSQKHDIVLVNDESVKVEGSQNLLRVTGQGTKISIIGNQNGITVDGQIKRIALLGDQNRLTVVHHAGTDKPLLTQTGTNNDVVFQEAK